MNLSNELKAALKDMPSDITVAQARLALIAKYIPLPLWEELSLIEKAKGPDHPLKRCKHRSIDPEPDLPVLPSTPPVPPKPAFTCVKCGGSDVSESLWLHMNEPVGWPRARPCWDEDACDCLDHQYYCHDCDEVFGDIDHNGV